jgi:hypothetical protein
MKPPPETKGAAPARTAPENLQCLSRPCASTDSEGLNALQAATLAARYRLPLEHAAIVAALAFARVAP